MGGNERDHGSKEKKDVSEIAQQFSFVIPTQLHRQIKDAIL